MPELWESSDEESTLMKLRTVSLLPEHTLKDLSERFGTAFNRLEENERMALVTAAIEGYVTNGRLQQICRKHPRDITTLLKNLVDSKFLTPDGQGRATTYRLFGTQPLDLAEAFGLLDNAQKQNLSPEDIRSKDPSQRTEKELLKIAEAIRKTKRVQPEEVRRTILELCRGKFLTLNKLAQLLDRSSGDLRQRFVKKLVESEQLLYQFPNQPNHEKQAYRTNDILNE